MDVKQHSIVLQDSTKTFVNQFIVYSKQNNRFPFKFYNSKSSQRKGYVDV